MEKVTCVLRFLLKSEVSQMWVQLQSKLKFNQNWPDCPIEEIK